MPMVDLVAPPGAPLFGQECRLGGGAEHTDVAAVFPHGGVHFTAVPVLCVLQCCGTVVACTFLGGGLLLLLSCTPSV